MAHTPAASSWRAASWSWTISPVVCRPKSMIVVVPPHAAAAVPVSKSSDENVPPNGQVHVHVRVDPARHHVLAGGVDGAVGGDAGGGGHPGA